MTDYLRSMLGERERILLVTRQHWFVLTASIFLEVLLFGLIIAAVVSASILTPLAPFGLILLVIPIVSMVRDILIWYNRQYIVTNRRVIQISGLINKNVIDSSLEKVNDVKMKQSFFGRIFDYGDVEILTASDLGVNLFARIGDPIRFKTAMLNAKEELSKEDDGPRRSSASSAREETLELIAHLDALRKNGVLTEEEFAKKKAELLAQM